MASPFTKKLPANRALTEAQEAWLIEQVQQHRDWTLEVMKVQVREQFDVSISLDSLSRLLARHEIKKVRRERSVAPRPKDPFRFQAHHRRETAGSYPSNLTDDEWACIAPLFTRTETRGRPETHTRRELLDAIHYVVRSGCAWRMLPKEFPKWQLTYATFRRWSKAGLFEQMHDRLRQRWREREARANEPTQAVLDSQSVRTSEKGGRVVSMRAKRSRDARGIL